MSDISGHFPSVEKPLALTREDLQSFDMPRWIEWLRRGLTLWTKPCTRGDQIGAFEPLPIKDLDMGAQYLANSLEFVGGLARIDLQRAIGQLIAIAEMGNGEARFLIELATFVGCAEFENSVRAMLTRDVTLGDDELHEFSASMVLALEKRCVPDQLYSLTIALASRHLLPPGPMIQLIANLAVREPSEFDAIVRRLSPELADENLEEEDGSFLVDQIAERATPEEIEAAAKSRASAVMWKRVIAELRRRQAMVQASSKLATASGQSASEVDELSKIFFKGRIGDL